VKNLRAVVRRPFGATLIAAAVSAGFMSSANPAHPAGASTSLADMASQSMPQPPVPANPMHSQPFALTPTSTPTAQPGQYPASDVIIPARPFISLIGWSGDGEQLAFSSSDPTLNLPVSTERVFVSDTAGNNVQAVGDISVPLGANDAHNPQLRPAAAWTPKGLVGERMDPDGTFRYLALSGLSGWVSPPLKKMFGVFVDGKGAIHGLDQLGQWEDDHQGPHGGAPAYADAQDEGAFSVSPDGQAITFARPTPNGQQTLYLETTDGRVQDVATAAFVAVDGWRSDSAAVAVRTGDVPNWRWGSEIRWYLTSGQFAARASALLGNIGAVVPSPADPQTALIARIPSGAAVTDSQQWSITTDGGATSVPFGARGAYAGAAWSPNGRSVAYLTLSSAAFKDGRVALHIARLAG